MSSLKSELRGIIWETIQRSKSFRDDAPATVFKPIQDEMVKKAMEAVRGNWARKNAKIKRLLPKNLR